MVIEETQSTLTPEIVTVKDLLGGPAEAEAVPEVPEAVPMPSGSPNIDRLEQWIRILDKGLSIADRGITILGKADSIVRNISEVIMKNNSQQQQQQQNVLPNPPIEYIKVPPAAVEGPADARDHQEDPEEVPANNDAGKKSTITAKTISGVLDMLLKQCPTMTVQELKELVDRNPNFINSMLSFIK